MAVDLSKFIDRFRQETREKLNVLNSDAEALSDQPGISEVERNKLIGEMMQLVHSIKGSGRMLGFANLDELCHAAEDLLIHIKGAPVTPEASVMLLIDAFEGIDRSLSEPPIGKKSAFPDWLNDLCGRLQTASAGVQPARTESASKSKLKTDIPESVEADTRTNLGEIADLGATVRVEVAKIDQVLHASRALKSKIEQLEDLFGAFFQLTGSVFDLKPGQLTGVGVDQKENQKWSDAVGETRNRITELIGEISEQAKEVDNAGIELRMRPISGLLDSLSEHAEMLAQALGKRVRVDISGGEVRLDGRVADLLEEAVVHIIRNAIDHGLEIPAERVETGKNPEGWIWVSVKESAGLARITIADDGRGIDLNIIWKRARELNLTDVANPDPSSFSQGYRFLFEDGFTSRSGASRLSGRGVGLSAVRRRMRELRGDVSIESVPGVVTRVILTVPTSLSSQRTMVTSVNYREAVPLFIGIPTAMVQSMHRMKPNGSVRIQQDGVSVAEISGKSGQSRPDYYEKHLKRAPGFEVEGKNEADAYVDVVEFLNTGAIVKAPENREMVLVVSDGISSVNLQVDRVWDDREVTIEPLPALVGHIPFISGVSPLSGDRIMLMLNIPALFNHIIKLSEGGGAVRQMNSSK